MKTVLFLIAYVTVLGSIVVGGIGIYMYQETYHWNYGRIQEYYEKDPKVFGPLVKDALKDGILRQYEWEVIENTHTNIEAARAKQACRDWYNKTFG